MDNYINCIVCSDAYQFLTGIPDATVNCIVTSPPYYGLRDYGVDGQIGLEDTPEAYVARLAKLFHEARRVLRDDGTLWLVIGDSYANSGKSSGQEEMLGGPKQRTNPGSLVSFRTPTGNLKPKDLIGIPWRIAFALQADGWWLRSDIIWHKPNPMPESVTDRPTKAHEYVFLMTKSERYWYDQEAIAVPSIYPNDNRASRLDSRKEVETMCKDNGSRKRTGKPTAETCNRRTVWTVATEPSPLPHYAMFPQALIVPMILAGCPKGGIVLDPFMGMGTVALVARRLGRNFTGCDIDQKSVDIATERLHYNGDDKRLLAEQKAGVRQQGLFEDVT